MRALALSLIAVAALGTAPAAAQSFVGEWRATATAQGGKVSETLSVKKVGKSYSITARNVTPAPPKGSPTAGSGTGIKISGNSFSYKRTLKYPGGSLDIVYRGTVSGNTFKGTVSVGEYSAPYNGVRLK